MGIISVGSCGIILLPNRFISLIIYLFLAVQHGPIYNRLIERRLGSQLILGVMLLDSAIL